MTCKALIIEDDPQLIDVITDALVSMGHDWDAVGSQNEALKRLKADTYTYVLSDISIPACPRNGRARIQNLENLLEQMASLKAVPPIIIMSDHAADGVKQTVDVMRLALAMGRRGAIDVIAKPFPTAGRTLDRVIKKVLSGKVDRVKITWPEPAKPNQTSSTDKAAEAKQADPRWASIPNEPVTIDDFMARFCEHRSKETRLCRKRALLAAARHKTVTLPPLAVPSKPGRTNKYLVHDLLAAWQGFVDDGVDLPSLFPQYG